MLENIRVDGLLRLDPAFAYAQVKDAALTASWAHCMLARGRAEGRIKETYSRDLRLGWDRGESERWWGR